MTFTPDHYKNNGLGNIKSSFLETSTVSTARLHDSFLVLITKPIHHAVKPILRRLSLPLNT